MTRTRAQARRDPGGLFKPLLTGLADDQFNALFNGSGERLSRKRRPDYSLIHAEKQTKGVTLLLLWEEYCLEDSSSALSYSHFTESYRRYVSSIERVMRQVHLPGKKLFVDFSGKKPYFIDQETGEKVEVELFVGVLGYSNYTFACAALSQSLPDWVDCHNRMFKFFGGVSELLVPDNLRSAVSRAGRHYCVNPTYLDLAQHYGAEVVPTRPYKPRDKAKVEVAVQIVQRWVVARLRNMTFFSLSDLNEEIGKQIHALNERPFKRIDGSRKSRFESEEKAQLNPLPVDAYVMAEWSSQLIVDKSYHVLWSNHWYSVPHTLVGERVVVRATHETIEILHKSLRVASHERSWVAGGHTTNKSHLPDAHRAYADRSTENYIAWGESIGPSVATVVRQQFNRRSPFLGFPACDSLQKLAQRHGSAPLEAAAERAIQINSLTVKSVRSLLSTGRYKRAISDSQATPPPVHPNVRGEGYYRQMKQE